MIKYQLGFANKYYLLNKLTQIFNIHTTKTRKCDVFSATIYFPQIQCFRNMNKFP